MNELAEINGKIIIIKTRFILINIGLLKKFWLEIVNIVIYFFNQLPTQELNKKILIKALNRSLFLKQDQDFYLNFNYFKVFGCTAYIYILKKKRKDSDKFGF